MIENRLSRYLLLAFTQKRVLAIGVFLSFLMVICPGMADLQPSFVAMNQANMTIGDSENLAYGDYLYLYDTTTIIPVDNITGYSWTITPDPTGAYTGPTTSTVQNPVFGPFLNEASLYVELFVENDTDVKLPTSKTFFVTDNHTYIRPGYLVSANYSNKSAEYPIGTMTFTDTSSVYGFPRNATVDWWWRVTNNLGVSWNGSSCDNFTVTLSDADKYMVNLTVKDNNGKLASVTGYVGVPPDDVGLIANAVAIPMVGYAPLNVSFVDLSTFYYPIRDNIEGNWKWNFDEGNSDPATPNSSSVQNPIHTYSKPGVYTANFTISDNFSTVSTLINPIIVYPAPAPSVDFAISPTRGEKPLNITVISQVSGLNGSPVYQWDFGDYNHTTSHIWDFNAGTAVNTSHPSYVYTYDPEGKNPTLSWNYTVNHRVISDGVTYPASYTQNVTVLTPNPPRARFTAYPRNGSAPLDVAFIDQSEGREPMQYEWYFDDDMPKKYDQNPNVTFAIAGNYTVTLRLKAANGYDQAYMNINVTEATKPFVDFAVAPTKGTNPLNVTVIAQCTGLNETPVYEWDFGNGSVESTTDQSYVYQYHPFSPDPNKNWTYPINLTVYSDGEEYYASKSRNVTIENAPTPKAAFNAYPRNGSVPFEVSFFDQSVGGEPINYEWYFGDNTPKKYEQNPTHVYQKPGVYDVTLMIHAKNGNDILNKTKLINVSNQSAPIAGFVPVPTSGPTPLNVSFIDTSFGDIIKWNWDFGDGNVSSIKNPSHVYVLGNYSPKLTITDRNGISNSTIGDIIKVYKPGDEYVKPVARFSYSIKPDNMTCSFSDQSEKVPTYWKWDFGDGNISYERNPVNVYPLYGPYKVMLTVSNPAGVNSTEQNIVLPAPVGDIKAGFTLKKTGIRTYEFEDNSSGPILTYIVSYGDGSVDTFKEKWTSYHSYTKMGYYNVSLTVTNGKNTDTYNLKFFVP